MFILSRSLPHLVGDDNVFRQKELDSLGCSLVHESPRQLHVVILHLHISLKALKNMPFVSQAIDSTKRTRTKYIYVSGEHRSV